MTAKQDLIDQLSKDIVKLLDSDEIADEIDGLISHNKLDPDAEDLKLYDAEYEVIFREVTGGAMLDALKTLLIGIPRP